MYPFKKKGETKNKELKQNKTKIHKEKIKVVKKINMNKFPYLKK